MDKHTKKSRCGIIPVMRRYLRRGDAVLAVLLLLPAAAALLWSQLYFGTQSGNTVEIRSHGELQGRYDLNEPQRIEVCDENGLHNTVIIADGSAWIEEADCPDQYCVKHEAISRSNQSIICLPAQLVVSVCLDERDNEESGVSIDVIAR